MAPRISKGRTVRMELQRAPILPAPAPARPPPTPRTLPRIFIFHPPER